MNSNSPLPLLPVSYDTSTPLLEKSSTDLGGTRISFKEGLKSRKIIMKISLCGQSVSPSRMVYWTEKSGRDLSNAIHRDWKRRECREVGFCERLTQMLRFHFSITIPPRVR